MWMIEIFLHRTLIIPSWDNNKQNFCYYKKTEINQTNQRNETQISENLNEMREESYREIEDEQEEERPLPTKIQAFSVLKGFCICSKF